MAVLIAAALAACSGTTPPGDAGGVDAGGGDSGALLPAPARSEGFQLSLDPVTVMPGQEVWRCQVMRAPNTSIANVGRVVSLQTPGMHHMDIMVLTFTGVDLAEGGYDCGPLYEQYPQLMDNGINLFASQMESMTVTLPQGTVAQLPPRLMMMYEVHYVNVTDAPVTVRSTTNAYTVPGDQVQQTIWGFPVRDQNINIPAHGQATEWSRCVMNEAVDVIFVATHTHALGRRATISRFDGTNVGAQLYENTSWQSPPLLQFQPALHLNPGEGFEFRCEYTNTRDVDVHWGFHASDEMCQIAMVFTPGSTTARCDVVQTSDGVLPSRGDGGVADGGGVDAAVDGM
jgi:hypothetical protein